VGHNVQSQAGISLSDIYDVRGGQAAVERLVSTDVPVTHELGGTIFSERFSMFARRDAQNNAASVNIDMVFTGLPGGISRVLAVNMFTDDATRLLDVTVSLEGTGVDTGMPIWQWDQVNSRASRFIEAGIPQNLVALVPEPAFTFLPNLLVTDAPQSFDQIGVRGRTAAFGAGNVLLTASILLGFAAIGGISSRGLPIPGW